MRSILAAIAILCGTFASTVRAETTGTATWGKVEGWEVRVDQTLGYGCFAFQSFERGSLVRIGFNPKTSSIYVMFGNAAWKSLEAGKVYRMKFVFDGTSTYEGELKGVLVNNFTFLEHRNVSTAFVDDFMKRNSMEVFYNGQKVTGLSLRNTYAAVSEVINCQKELIAAGRSPSFSNSTARPTSSDAPRASDPFR
jgi:hypothetical protein